MRTAVVGDVLTTLKRFGRNHLLVAEAAPAGAPRRVRGVLLRSQLDRQLGQPIELTPVASRFAEIEPALARGFGKLERLRLEAGTCGRVRGAGGAAEARRLSQAAGACSRGL